MLQGLTLKRGVKFKRDIEIILVEAERKFSFKFQNVTPPPPKLLHKEKI